MPDPGFREKELQAYWSACQRLRHGAADDRDYAIDDLIDIYTNTDWPALQDQVGAELDSLVTRLTAAR